MAIARADLYQLIDQLPDQEALVVKKFMEFLLAQTDQRLLDILAAAPEEDHQLTQDDLEDIQEAEEAIHRGETFSLELLKKDLGL